MRVDQLITRLTCLKRGARILIVYEETLSATVPIWIACCVSYGQGILQNVSKTQSEMRLIVFPFLRKRSYPYLASPHPHLS